MAGTLPTVSDCCSLCDGLSVTVTESEDLTEALGVFDTLALMRADLNYADDRVVILRGELSSGDGGGGVYVYDSASVAAHAFPTVVKPTAVGAAAGAYIKLV